MKVVVASNDREFRRLASAVLAHAGHTVRGTGMRARRIRHLVRVLEPSVLVFDTEDDSPTRIRSILLHEGITVGLVLIADESSSGPAGVPVIGRWHCSSKLVKAVEAAAHPVAPPPRLEGDKGRRPGLRLVGRRHD